MKKFLKSSLGRTIIAWLFHKYCLFAYYTSRRLFIGEKQFSNLIKSGNPVIFAFWHGRLMFVPFLDKDKKRNSVIISKHKDGVLIARVVDFFGIKHIRGSSNRSKSHKKGAKNRGGMEATRQSVKLLEEGKNLSITPDGPRGPRMRAQSGVAHIAKIANVPVIPVTYSTSRCKIFGSWDSFMLPLPFGKIVAIYGNPITISKDANDKELEKTRKEIENQLNKLTNEADRLVGNIPVEPA